MLNSRKVAKTGLNTPRINREIKFLFFLYKYHSTQNFNFAYFSANLTFLVFRARVIFTIANIIRKSFTD